MSAASTIVFLPGDGIGPEVMAAARAVLQRCCDLWSLDLELVEYPVGGQALDLGEEPLPGETLQACREARAVLLGAVGHPRYSDVAVSRRPEQALLALRSELGLFANLRPVRVFEALLEASPLRPERIRGVDLLIVRELTGGIYFGEPRGRQMRDGRRVALDTEVYGDWEIDRIARVAFEAAGRRRNRVTSADKANVLESSRLWREVVEEVARDYPEVQLEHQLIDSCAMRLVAEPGSFDVLLTGNLFGDILSDEAAMLTGSIGMLPSASLAAAGESRRAALYEPVHGSAPDIAGQDQANPLAAVCCVSMMLRHSLDRPDIGAAVDDAVETVLAAGLRTADLCTGDQKAAGTLEMTEAVLEAMPEPSAIGRGHEAV